MILNSFQSNYNYLFEKELKHVNEIINFIERFLFTFWIKN